MLNLLFIFPGVGALFSSCMREDYKLMLEISKKNYSSSTVLGCCEVAIKNTAGTMTQEECDQETGGLVNSKSKITELKSRRFSQFSIQKYGINYTFTSLKLGYICTCAQFIVNIFCAMHLIYHLIYIIYWWNLYRTSAISL